VRARAPTPTYSDPAGRSGQELPIPVAGGGQRFGRGSLATPLVLVHGLISDLQQALERRVLGQDSAANAQTEGHQGITELQRFPVKHGADLRDEVVDEGRASIRTDDDELVAAPPTDQVTGADEPGQARRRLQEKGVPGPVTGSVIGRLEPIDVHERNDQRATVSLSPRHGGTEFVLYATAVGQARQGVGQRLLQQLADSGVQVLEQLVVIGHPSTDGTDHLIVDPGQHLWRHAQPHGEGGLVVIAVSSAHGDDAQFVAASAARVGGPARTGEGPTVLVRRHYCGRRSGGPKPLGTLVPGPATIATPKR
jgi:hypothetical protein